MKVPAVIDHLILPIRVILVLAVVYALVQTVLFFVFGQGVSRTTDTTDLQEFSMPSKVSARDIIDANLFGALPTETIEPEIVETTLNLKLVGISYYSTDPTKSRAFIVGRARAKPVSYSVGERVEGIAELTDILQDHVLLLRGGKKESLYVEARDELISRVEETSFVPELPSMAQGLITQTDLGEVVDTDPQSAAPQTGWIRQFYETNRVRIDEDADQFLNEMGVTAVAEDSAAGYRLDATVAERFGLRTGDVLVSINGNKVGKVQEDLAHVGDYLDADSLKLEIQRGETTITVNYRPNP